MKRFLILAIAAMAVTGLVTLAGCDDDDNGTGSQIRTGDTTDAQFQLVRNVMLGEDGWSPFAVTDTTVFLTIDLLDTVLEQTPAGTQLRYDGPGLALQEPYLLMYNAESQYWYRFAETVVDSFEYMWEDSIQLITADGPVQFLDTATLVSLNAGTRITSVMNVLDTVWTVAQQISMTGDVLTLGDVMLNGNQSFDAIVGFEFDTLTTVCRFDLSTTTSLEEIEMNLLDVSVADGCPTAGRLTQNAFMDVLCVGDTSIDFSGQWTLTETFYVDSVKYEFRSGNTRWSYTGECRPTVPPPAAAIEWSELRP